ncbi:hypothetical protein [Streptomyces sp. NPDC048057]|uniref:hypothetical protein n=1 Tax=Streptomyces sp. NPDC048057 TaxID=3155628 RepID=UPI0033FBD283
MVPRLVFVHGIGGPRDPARDREGWCAALAKGMADAGHTRFADALPRRTDCVFAHYADLFRTDQAQGAARTPAAASDEADLLAELMVAWVGQHADADAATERARLLLARARAEADVRDQSQGALDVVRRAINVATTMLSLRPWSAAAGWITPKLMVHHLAQVARYLARGEQDAAGQSLDRRIRARIAEAIDGRPAVVVAHSLGTVVALETLHETPSPTPLLVTLGSPIALRTVVRPRLHPQPPSVPACVTRWHNHWDRDDIVAARPLLEDDLLPSPTGVLPRSRRVDSDGFWVHSAETYLAHPDVAGPVAEALQDLAGA